jgi:hypothetical protein
MKHRAITIAMTVLWCAVLVTAMHDWTLGLCMGLLLGVGFGLFDAGDDTKKEESQ